MSHTRSLLPFTKSPGETMAHKKEMLLAAALSSPATCFQALGRLFARWLSGGLGRAHSRLTLTALCVVAAGPAFLVLARGNVDAVYPALLTSAGVVAMMTWHRLTGSRWARAAVMIAMSTALASDFFATQRVVAIRRPTLKDAALLRADAGILGWLWPQGQIALWADVNPIVGPASPLGRVICDVLSACYFSYYVWPYLLMLLHLGRAALCSRRRDVRGEAEAWAAAELFVSAWTFGFMATFAVNGLCPAVSPRLFLKDLYQSKLPGLAALLSPVTNHDDTFGSFPSGHVGETIITGACALIVPAALAPWYGKLVTSVGVGIAIATLWLRYHYAVDALATLPLLAVALAWGLMLPRDKVPAAMQEAVEIAEQAEQARVSGTPLEVAV
eukprot:m51a1_g54 hypothetical protein (387) ;mRNA; r:174549-175959